MGNIESNFENKEFQEEEKLRTIEEALIDSGKKLNLALLVLEKKEAAQLGNFDVVESDQHREELDDEFTEESQAIKELLNELGLEYSLKDVHEDNGIMGFSFLVSRNLENLEKFKKASEEGDDKMFGMLAGYPETAINAYQTEGAFDFHEGLSSEELKKLEEEGLMPFIGFMPSKAHWEDELQEVRRQQQLIKEKMPRLYDELIK